MKKFARFVVFTILILSLVSAGVFWIITDKSATVEQSSLHGLNDAESVTKLLGEIQTSIYDRSNAHTVTINKTQLDSLLAFAERAKPELKSRASLSQYVSTLELSYELPEKWSGRYINLNVSVLPGQNLHIENVRMGGLSIRGDWALSILTFVADKWTSSDIATYAVEQITQVSMSKEFVRISMRPLDGLLKQLNELGSNQTGEEDTWLSERTAYYVRFLARMSANDTQLYQIKDPSLSIYLIAIMDYANKTGISTADKENEAALLALTIFAGHHRFANFVGNVHPDPERAPAPPHPTLLSKRQDLSQHFIISAGLKLLSEKRVSSAVGEFKELMDRVLGGSGYSFVDLAADMAGVRLAQLAIDPRYAQQIQQMLASSEGEGLFFPDVTGLPEGITKQQFSEQFGDVNSEQYKQMISLIKNRLDKMPLYSLNPDI